MDKAFTSKLFCLLLFLFLTISAQYVLADPGDRRGGPRTPPDLPLAAASPEINFKGVYLNQQHFSPNSLESIYSDLAKKIRFAPYIEVNPNRGSLRTSFEISLPPSLSPLKILKFNYDSQNEINGPYGVGWSLDLPEIETNIRGDAYAPYLVKGLSNTELMPGNENEVELLLLDYRKEKIINLMQIAFHRAFDTSNIEITRLKPVVDEDYTAYVQLLYKDGGSVGFLASKLSGDQYVFDEYGKLIFVSDVLGNGVSLKWTDRGACSGKIFEGTEEQNASWSVNLVCKSMIEEGSNHYLPVWQRGEFTAGDDQKLVSINFLHKHGERRDVLFDYNNNQGTFYLESVKYQDGFKPLFQGRYGPVYEGHKDEIVPNDLKDNDNIMPFYSFSDHYQQHRNDQKSDTQEIYIDLDNDQITDKIVIDQTERNSNIKQDCKHSLRYNAGFTDFQNKYNSITKGFKTKFRFFKGMPDGTYTDISEDKELSFFDSQEIGKQYLEPYDFIIESDDILLRNTDRAYYTMYIPKFKTYPNAIKFVDINGDGLKDLVHCKGLPQYAEEGDNASKRPPLIIMSILKLISPNNPIISSFWPKNMPDPLTDSTISSDDPTIIYQKTHVREAVPFAVANSSKSFIGMGTDINTDTDTKGDFRCNADSIFFDFNSDGIVDVLTGRTLYLRGKNGISLVNRLNDEELNSLFGEEGISEINTSKGTRDFFYADINGDGKLEIIQGKSVERNSVNGRLTLFLNGSTVSRPVSSRYELLSALISHFGGVINVDYKLQDGIFVVDKIVKDPNRFVEKDLGEHLGQRERISMLPLRPVRIDRPPVVNPPRPRIDWEKFPRDPRDIDIDWTQLTQGNLNDRLAIRRYLEMEREIPRYLDRGRAFPRYLDSTPRMYTMPHYLKANSLEIDNTFDAIMRNLRGGTDGEDNNASRMERIIWEASERGRARYNYNYNYHLPVFGVEEMMGIHHNTYINQPKTILTYSYKTRLFDPHNGNFLGFLQTTEKKSIDAKYENQSIFEDALTIKEFSIPAPLQRIETTRYLSRGTLSGKLSSIKRINLKDNKILSEQIYNWDRKEGLGKIVVSLKSLIAREFVDDKVAKETKTFYDYNNWTNGIFPIEESITVSDETNPSDRKTESILYKFSPRYYLRAPVRKTTFINGEQATSPIFFEVDDSDTHPGKVLSYRTGNFSLDDNKFLYKKFEYDRFNRVIETKDQKGYIQRLTYKDNLPLVSSVSDIQGTSSANYFLLTGEIKDLTTNTNVHYSNTYSTDGILLSQKENDTNIYFLNLPSINTDVISHYQGYLKETTVIYDRRLLQKVAPDDMLVHWDVDGFGRVENTLITRDKTIFTSGRRHYGDDELVWASEISHMNQILPPTERRSGGSIQLSSIVDVYDAIGTVDFYDVRGDIYKKLEMAIDPLKTKAEQTEHIDQTINRRFEKDGRLCLARDFNEWDNDYVECSDGFSNVVSVEEGNGSERFNFIVDPLNRIRELLDLGLIWNYDQNSLVTDVMATQSKEHSPSWIREEYDYNLLANTITNKSTGESSKFDQLNRLLEVRSDLLENYTYDTAPGALLSKESLQTNDEDKKEFFVQDYKYDNTGKILERQITVPISNISIVESYTYDKYHRLITYSLNKNGQQLITEKYSYDKDLLTTIDPIISDIHYNSFQMFDLLIFSSAARPMQTSLTFAYDHRGKNLDSISLIRDNNNSMKLFYETYQRNNYHQVTERKTRSFVGSDLSLAKVNVNTENFNYNINNHKLESEMTSAAHADSERDDRGRVINISGAPVAWTGNNLKAANGYKYYYRGSGEIFAACPVPNTTAAAAAAATATIDDSCTIKIRDDLYLVGKTLLKLVLVGGTPVGIYIDSTFYPIVVDQLGSVRAMLDTKSGELLWRRDYSAHGLKTVQAKDEAGAALERIIPWSFAGLAEFTRSSNNAITLYHSKSRIYSPNIREWLSVDPLLKTSPQTMVKNPGNWYSVEYVGGDPLNMVDLSGHNAWLVQDIAGAGQRGHSGIVVGNDRDGYLLMSMGTRGGSMPAIMSGSTREGVGIIQGSSFNDVVNKSHKLDTIQIYDKALMLKTTREQDLKMMKYGIERSQTDKNYSPFFNNCGDFARDTFKSGGIDSSRDMIPNDYYSSFKSDHPSSTEIHISR